MSDRSIRQQKRRTQSIVTYSVMGALILALVLYLVFRNTNRIQYELPDVAKIESQTIDTIRVVSEKNGIIETRKSGTSWVLGAEGYPMDASRLDDMLEAIEGFAISELVSTAEYYDRYELDEASKLEVIVSGGDKTLIRFDVGKRSPSYNHTYIRLPGDSRVFQAEGNFRNAFDKAVDELRDKLVFDIDPEIIMSVGITTDTESYRIYRTSKDEEPMWKSDDETEWDSETITEALGRLKDLTCQSFLEDESAVALEAPRLVLDLQGEQTDQFFIYDEVDSKYRARSSQSQYGFIISSYTAERLIEAFDRSSKTGEE